MEKINIIYIDDSTSRFFHSFLSNLSVKYNNVDYTFDCERFDWDIKNPKEIDRLFTIIKNKNINIFFIDSALYDIKSNQTPKFYGIWVAYIIKANIPRSHIAIVSSNHKPETSFAHPSFVFLEKTSRDGDKDEASKKYEETISIWLKEDFVFAECCEEFKKTRLLINDNLENEVKLSLARMDLKEELTKEDFAKVIELLQDVINNEE